MKTFTLKTGAWLAQNRTVQDLESPRHDNLPLLDVTFSPGQGWLGLGYTRLGEATVTIECETPTDEQINARIDALTARAKKIREEANAEADALEQEAFKMLPGYTLANKAQEVPSA